MVSRRRRRTNGGGNVVVAWGSGGFPQVNPLGGTAVVVHALAWKRFFALDLELTGQKRGTTINLEPFVFFDLIQTMHAERR